MQLLYTEGETFERNGHRVEILRDVPWNGWPNFGDILVDGVPLKSGDSGPRVSWQWDELCARADARKRRAGR
jgi:hypothetical protein